MAFIDINRFLTLSDNKDRPKIGIVIDNNDPEHKGRVRVHLEGIFEPEDKMGSNLPWIRKEGHSFYGLNNFVVPDIGSPVELIWKFGSKLPMYKPGPHEANGYDEHFLPGYPYSWGWCDNGGFLFRVDRASNEFIIKTKFFTLEVDALGSFKLSNKAANIDVDAAGNININGGNIILSGNVEIEGRGFLEHVHSNGHQGSNTGGVV